MNKEEIEAEILVLTQTYDALLPLYPAQRLRVLSWINSRVAELNKTNEGGRHFSLSIALSMTIKGKSFARKEKWRLPAITSCKWRIDCASKKAEETRF